jgi:hypothetical protein
LEEGVSKSSDVLLREAFVQDIETYVDQQFNSCDSMSIQQLPSIGSEQLFITGGCGCTVGTDGGCGCTDGGCDCTDSTGGGNPLMLQSTGKVLPGNTDLIIAKKLVNQIPNSFLQDLKGKMFAVFGPTSQQYKYIVSIINRVATNRKNAIYYKYQNNYKQMELEFLKIDTCATNIKEKILQNITMYPTYGAICRIQTSNNNNILLKMSVDFVDLISKQVELTYNHAKGYKEIIKKCIKIIGKKINHIMKESQLIKDSNEINKITKGVNDNLDEITSLTGIQEKIRNDIADEYESINNAIFNFKTAIKNADFVYNKKYITIKNKNNSFNVRKQILNDLNMQLQPPNDSKSSRVTEEVIRKLKTINEQKNTQKSYNDIFTKPIEEQNKNVDVYIESIKKTIINKVDSLDANADKYRDIMLNIIEKCRNIIMIELEVNLTRLSNEDKKNIQTPEDLFKYVDRHTEKNLMYRIQELNMQNNIITMYQHKKNQINVNINKYVETLNKHIKPKDETAQEKETSENMDEHENIIKIYSVNLLRKNIDKLFTPGNAKLSTCLMRLHKLYNILRNDKIDKMFKVSNDISKMNNFYMISNNLTHNILNEYKLLIDVHTKGFLSLVHGLLKIKLSIEACFNYFVLITNNKANVNDLQKQKELYLSNIDYVYDGLIGLTDYDFAGIFKTNVENYNKSKANSIDKCFSDKKTITLDSIITSVVGIMKTYDIPPVENMGSVIAGFVAYDIYESL